MKYLNCTFLNEKSSLLSKQIPKSNPASQPSYKIKRKITLFCASDISNCPQPERNQRKTEKKLIS